jgi:soluble lytic murein transglycosylase-like protein
MAFGWARWAILSLIGILSMANLFQDNLALAQEPIVDMDILKIVESSGNPKAYNKKSQARGLYQITPIVLKEWNNYHPKQKYDDPELLFNPNVNQQIAQWYISERIPQMLKVYKKPLTIDNILASYNAGIKYVKEGLPLPKETKGYLKKYYKALK